MSSIKNNKIVERNDKLKDEWFSLRNTKAFSYKLVAENIYRAASRDYVSLLSDDILVDDIKCNNKSEKDDTSSLSQDEIKEELSLAFEELDRITLNVEEVFSKFRTSIFSTNEDETSDIKNNSESRRFFEIMKCDNTTKPIKISYKDSITSERIETYKAPTLLEIIEDKGVKDKAIIYLKRLIKSFKKVIFWCNKIDDVEEDISYYRFIKEITSRCPVNYTVYASRDVINFTLFKYLFYGYPYSGILKRNLCIRAIMPDFSTSKFLSVFLNNVDTLFYAIENLAYVDVQKDNAEYSRSHYALIKKAYSLIIILISIYGEIEFYDIVNEKRTLNSPYVKNKSDVWNRANVEIKH